MRRVELVFRTVGERTSAAALDLARRHVRPDRVHVIEGIRPFSKAVEAMMALEHDADVVVYLDADTLIFEDLRPFLEFSSAPFVDGVVKDRFRGRAQCGLHIVRADVVAAMQAELGRIGGLPAVRPESTLRAAAMERLGVTKQLKRFHALHDHLQAPADVFAKMALRELRTRDAAGRARLDAARARWGEAPDLDVARAALDWARRTLPRDAAPQVVTEWVEALPGAAAAQVEALELPAPTALSDTEVEAAGRAHRDAFDHARPKVFGVGLECTGEDSLTRALEILGWEVAHDPVDPVTLADLQTGHRDMGVLRLYQGLTGLVAAAQVDRMHQAFLGARFILTVRNRPSWLKTLARQWDMDPPRDPREALRHSTILELLRRRAYGTVRYDRDVLARAYERHVAATRRRFRGRPRELLVMDIIGGDGWEELCAFLDVPVPDVPFPHAVPSHKAPPRATWTRRQKVRAQLSDWLRRGRRKARKLKSEWAPAPGDDR